MDNETIHNVLILHLRAVADNSISQKMESSGICTIKDATESTALFNTYAVTAKMNH